MSTVMATRQSIVAVVGNALFRKRRYVRRSNVSKSALREQTPHSEGIFFGKKQNRASVRVRVRVRFRVRVRVGVRANLNPNLDPSP
jgi:hypothetical protein